LEWKVKTKENIIEIAKQKENIEEILEAKQRYIQSRICDIRPSKSRLRVEK